MPIDYDHGENRHTVQGALAALSLVLGELKFASLLDVGCGTGTWLEAARELGITDVLGLDGIEASAAQLRIPNHQFRKQDLTLPWELGRRFDLVLCLEVAEHLEEAFAAPLVQTLAAHTNVVLFSAACPGQSGQHHVNCQWPVYWQSHFNREGYVCSDALRWKLWDATDVEPWYQQNIFLARRAPDAAGQEPRIRSVLHPRMQQRAERALFERHLGQIEEGRLSLGWHVTAPFKSLLAKARRKFNRLHSTPR